ncbi:hypothetical protein RR45_GL000620 [Lactococcus chungangensis CAU 28 = DSM 22330]|uniref:Uncharacterized protein n=1 Tax=Pseudolactococcus chungangensis CAU 28 = DSM 22330 TaxID=1122154 RepID=A0ABX4I7J5_9LACT|nr:hypothetical protein RR45_GL000620 [Lactococcus chungangensis CAU 28 = DSM 22330]
MISKDLRYSRLKHEIKLNSEIKLKFFLFSNKSIITILTLLKLSSSNYQKILSNKNHAFSMVII